MRCKASRVDVLHLAVWALDTPPLAAGCFIALVHPDFLQVAVTGNDDGGTGIQCERHELVVIGITADPFIRHRIEKLNQLGKLGEDACADQDIGVNDDGWCLIRHEAVGTRLLQ